MGWRRARLGHRTRGRSWRAGGGRRDMEVQGKQGLRGGMRGCGQGPGCSGREGGVSGCETQAHLLTETSFHLSGVLAPNPGPRG